VDGTHPAHEAIRTALLSDPGPFLLSPFILAEVDYLLRTRFGVTAELRLLREVAANAYRLVEFRPSMVESALGLIARYRDADIGLADASVAVVAAQALTTRVLTLDETDFRLIRPLWGTAFTLLPADEQR
jgi:predicted nucleic acid-binding protein